MKMILANNKIIAIFKRVITNSIFSDEFIRFELFNSDSLLRYDVEI
jgi:hypothetical protein